jgi:regulatory protein
MFFTPTAPSLKSRALRLLSAREYSRAELVRKLTPHEEQPGTLAQALDELEAKGFINEQRVAESVVNRRSRKLGATRIRHELQTKGLDAQLVSDAVAQLQSTELARARDIWQRKFGQLEAATERAAQSAATARQMRFLLTRGFSAEVVRRVVRSPDAEVEDGNDA